MMRLQRVGRKNDPSFRVVVVDKRTGPKSNKNIDILGSYNPKLNHVQIDKDKATEWLSKGVQPSDTVHNILVGQKVIEGSKKNVLPKKSPIVGEVPDEGTEKAEENVEEGEVPESTDGDSPTEEPPKDAEGEAEAVPEVEEEKEDEVAPAEEKKEETPKPEKKDDAPAEESAQEETPAEEKKQG